MVQKYKIKRRQSASWLRFIPAPLQSFMARRVYDGLGLSYLVLGLFTLISLISYQPSDPSWNTAASGSSIQNWAGAPGAGWGDLLLQTVGAGGFLLGTGLTLWGISLLRRRPIRPFTLRLMALVVATLLASMALARVPSFGWLTQPWLGGSAGQIMLQSMTDQLGGLSHGVVAMISGALALAVFSVASALRRDEWMYAGSLLLAWAYGLYDRLMAFGEWVRHYGDEDHAPARKVRGPVIAKNTLPRRQPILLEAKTADEDEDEESEEDDSEDDEDETEYDDENRLAAGNSLASIKVVAPGKVKVAGTRQSRFQLFDGGEWELPALDLLQNPPDDHEAEQLDENALRMNAELLQNVLSDFNVQGEIVSIHPGPVVTLYELEPAPGTKSSRVIGLADDIARSMSAVSVRVAVVPGRNVIGIELPNKKRQTVYLQEMLITNEYDKTQARLPLVLGKDIGGKPIIADLARMPHLLVAGTTGSGKSVAINTMVLSLLYRLPPEKCRFIMIDPKMLELSVYDDIPHLLAPVVTEPGRAIVALKWVVQEMEERYRSMSKLGVRNIDGYNARLAEARKKGEALMRKVQTGFDVETGKPVYEEQPLDLTDLPYIVVIVDEFADLMLVAGKDVENAIQRLAQMARAAGIHLIMATQRPSVDVITGVIKANFPTRISFAVTSKIDSRTILGEGGAEQLLGQGDMLYMAAGGRITRVHGPFASDADVENVVNFLKSQAEPSYLEEITEGNGDFGDSEIMNAIFAGREEGGSNDNLYDQAVALVAREQKASTSFIQRHLQIGYNKAATLIERMEKEGVVTPANRVGKREVLVGAR
ncbi:MAG: DNA translocase FtsK 4TM domain-containing protein [Alphaproteobacteria bacterium]|nr:DNA translocase FtsK 4TM domain-containing protein [Alphaproteobacteria bacterium]